MYSILVWWIFLFYSVYIFIEHENLRTQFNDSVKTGIIKFYYESPEPCYFFIWNDIERKSYRE